MKVGSLLNSNLTAPQAHRAVYFFVISLLPTPKSTTARRRRAARWPSWQRTRQRKRRLRAHDPRQADMPDDDAQGHRATNGANRTRRDGGNDANDPKRPSALNCFSRHLKRDRAAVGGFTPAHGDAAMMSRATAQLNILRMAARVRFAAT